MAGSDQYYVIRETMNICTHRICSDVIYQHLKPHIVAMFSPMTIERVEAKGANYDKMTELCSQVKSLSSEKFSEFVAAIGKEHEHVAQEIDAEFARQLQIPENARN